MTGEFNRVPRTKTPIDTYLEGDVVIVNGRRWIIRDIDSETGVVVLEASDGGIRWTTTLEHLHTKGPR